MFTRDDLVKALTENDFVRISGTKKNGEAFSKIATLRKRPDAESPKGVRETNQDNFRFYEWGRPNRFDPEQPGDWVSCIVANVTAIEPVTL
jgi:hypothetical protein